MIIGQRRIITSVIQIHFEMLDTQPYNSITNYKYNQYTLNLKQPFNSGPYFAAVLTIHFFLKKSRAESQYINKAW